MDAAVGGEVLIQVYTVCWDPLTLSNLQVPGKAELLFTLLESPDMCVQCLM